MTDTEEKQEYEFKAARDKKGKIIHFSGSEDEGKFQQDMTDWGNQNSYGTVINDSDKYMPTEPSGAYQRKAAGRDDSRDRKEITHYESAKAKWDVKCHRFLAAYMAALSDDIVQYIEGALPNHQEGSSANILAIRALVRQQYGGYTVGKAEINFLAMNLIGNFTSPETVTSGCNELTKLYKERAS